MAEEGIQFEVVLRCDFGFEQLKSGQGLLTTRPKQRRGQHSMLLLTSINKVAGNVDGDLLTAAPKDYLGKVESVCVKRGVKILQGFARRATCFEMQSDRQLGNRTTERRCPIE